MLKNLLGQKFGKLLVLERGPDEIIESGKKYVIWNCQCDCGNIKLIRANNLNDGTTEHCGCIRDNTPRNDLKPGDKFERLTLISYFKGKWTCQCDCGKTIECRTILLTTGDTKSCGCFKIDMLNDRVHKLWDITRKFNPRESSARKVWSNTYFYLDKEKFGTNANTISFEDFLKITQNKCYYCNSSPMNIVNRFKGKKPIEGDFTYNGLDRIDSSLPHNKDNCLTCCVLCNRAKSNRSINDFKSWVLNLQIIDKKYEIITKKLPKGYNSSVLIIWQKNYADGDLTREEFECLSQYNCHYCNNESTNRNNWIEFNKCGNMKNFDRAEFKYNGLDRVNSDLPHNKDNVVPCCKYCNWAKGKLSLQEFHDWILRIKANVANWDI